ncbi:MAG: hypothetical protein ACOWWR_13165, partial [Eubacteriales bacterium]
PYGVQVRLLSSAPKKVSSLIDEGTFFMLVGMTGVEPRVGRGVLAYINVRHKTQMYKAYVIIKIITFGEGDIISEDSIKKGKKNVLATIFAIDLYYIVNFFVDVSREGNNIFISILGLILVCFITYFLYQGSKFAYMLMQTLFISPVVTIIVHPLIDSGILNLYFWGLIFLIIIMFLVFYGIIKFWRIKNITDFLQSQRMNREEN